MLGDVLRAASGIMTSSKKMKQVGLAPVKSISVKRMKHVIFVIGAPGCGIEKFCARMSVAFNYELIATMALAKETADVNDQSVSVRDKSTGDIKRKEQETSALFIVKTIRKHIEQSTNHTFLIYGFPRTVEDMYIWNAGMSDIVRAEHLLELQYTEADTLKRMFDKGLVNLFVKKMELIVRRFQRYQDDMLPIMQHFQTAGLYRQIGVSRDMDKFMKDAEKVLGLM